MADQIALVDTTILIDYFRKTDKANAKLVALFDQNYDFSISAITHYEIYSGATASTSSMPCPLLHEAVVRISTHH